MSLHGGSTETKHFYESTKGACMPGEQVWLGGVHARGVCVAGGMRG